MLNICIADVEPRLHWYNPSISVINHLVFLILGTLGTVLLRLHVLILRLLLVVLPLFIFLMVMIALFMLPAGYKTNNQELIIMQNAKLKKIF